MSKEICSTIVELLKAVDSVEEINQLYSAMKFRYNQIKQDNLVNKVLSGAVYVGGKVKFSGRKGNIVHGIVEKINNKNVKVKEMRKSPFGSGLEYPVIWTVSGNLLQPDD